MVKLFRTSGTATTVIQSTTNRVIVIEIWTINDVVEKLIATTTLEASTVNVVETIEMS